MFGTTERVDYKEYAEGTWGEFVTRSGSVAFLMTQARLGSPKDTDRSSRLTGLLSPVREVLEVKNLNFNQLLQRDLDDHRVATALLPYVMKDKATGPGFFPPILAVLLPFAGSVAAESFPDVTELSGQQIPGFEGSTFHERRFGSAFRFQRMSLPNGAEHPVRFGRVGWNPETCKLVVIDGQHRAMALLAIQRTLTESWRGSPGEKYRYFYEAEVKRLLKEGGGIGADSFARVEFPVTICWFPELSGPNARPHVAARKLFVDVNQNARQPSQSRLVLLSDTELVNVFARTLLNRLREDAPPFPLYAVEYDNPDARSYRPVRWSVVTNLLILRDIVERVVFGPRKYVQKVDLAVIGSKPWGEMDGYFREQFKVADILPSEIEEGASSPVLKRDALGNESFPQYNKEAAEILRKRFMELWGDAILLVIGGFLPWRCHIEALEELAGGWMAGDAAVSSLAKDAVFEGVGMYWTLRDAEAHWHQEVANGQTASTTVPEIVQAWKLIDRTQPNAKAHEFFGARSAKYWGRSESRLVDASEELYGVLNTYACQLGAMLTVASVRFVHPEMTPLSVAKILVEAWNEALTQKSIDDRRRRYFMRKDANALNMLTKMDSPDAVHFRYFFLELLGSDEAKGKWAGTLDESKLNKLTGAARTLYRERLVSDFKKSIKKTKPALKDLELLEEARAMADDRLRAALKHFFRWKHAEYQAWRDVAESKPSVEEQLAVQGASGESEGGGEDPDADYELNE